MTEKGKDNDRDGYQVRHRKERVTDRRRQTDRHSIKFNSIFFIISSEKSHMLAEKHRGDENRQTDRQTDRQTGRQAGRQTEKNRQTDKQ